MSHSENDQSLQTQRAEEWLSHWKRSQRSATSGTLKIFLGMCAGVGKTFAMLKAAQVERAQGRDVVIGLVETHGRKETEAELAKLEILPKVKREHLGTWVEEFDLDSALARKPALILVDELAHTNTPGSRHPKRYQDVLELLRSGIDVFTTLNVQHLESRAEAVAAITHVVVRETVPDGILDEAVEIQLIDLSPDQLLERLKEGKVYSEDRKNAALQNFFKREHLTALREISLRVTADRVDRDLLHLRKGLGTEEVWQTGERLLVAIGPNPQGETLIRAARRNAEKRGASWIVVYIKDGAKLSADDSRALDRNLNLARELGAEVVIRDDADRVEGLVRTARERNVTQILLGKPEGKFAFSIRSRWLDKLFEKVGGTEIVFVPTSSVRVRGLHHVSFASWRGPKHHLGYALAVLVGATLFGALIHHWLGYYGVGLVLLASVLATGLFLAPGAVVALSIGQSLAWNYFFIEPIGTFAIERTEDIALCMIFVFTGVILGGATARLRGREEKYRRGEIEALALADLLALIRDSEQEALLLRDAMGLLKRYFDVNSTF